MEGQMLCRRRLLCRSVNVTVRDFLRGLPVFDRPLPAFDTESVPGEPSALFLSWLHEAIDAGVSEPHAMTLDTVAAGEQRQGHPALRQPARGAQLLLA